MQICDKKRDSVVKVMSRTIMPTVCESPRRTMIMQFQLFELFFVPFAKHSHRNYSVSGTILKGSFSVKDKRLPSSLIDGVGRRHISMTRCSHKTSSEDAFVRKLATSRSIWDRLNSFKFCLLLLFSSCLLRNVLSVASLRGKLSYQKGIRKKSRRNFLTSSASLDIFSRASQIPSNKTDSSLFDTF